MKETIKVNLIMTCFVIIIVGGIFWLLSFVGGYVNPELHQSYLIQFDGDIKKMGNEIIRKCDSYDPDMGGKRHGFFTAGASGDIYYIAVDLKDNSNRNKYLNALGVEFSREEINDIIIGSMVGGGKVPDNETYLFVKEAMDTLSDPLIESYFFRKYNIPLSIVDEDKNRNKLIETLTKLMETSLAKRNKLRKEHKWMKDNLCVE